MNCYNMKIALIFAFVINVAVIFYGCIDFNNTSKVITKFKTTGGVQIPTDEELRRLSEPKHIPFLIEHVRRLSTNVSDYRNTTELGARKIRIVLLMLLFVSVFNLALFLFGYLKQRKRAAS